MGRIRLEAEEAEALTGPQEIFELGQVGLGLEAFEVLTENRFEPLEPTGPGRFPAGGRCAESLEMPVGDARLAERRGEGPLGEAGPARTSTRSSIAAARSVAINPSGVARA